MTLNNNLVFSLTVSYTKWLLFRNSNLYFAFPYPSHHFVKLQENLISAHTWEKWQISQKAILLAKQNSVFSVVFSHRNTVGRKAFSDGFLDPNENSFLQITSKFNDPWISSSHAGGEPSVNRFYQVLYLWSDKTIQFNSRHEYCFWWFCPSFTFLVQRTNCIFDVALKSEEIIHISS